MEIYTSYYANVKKLTSAGIIPVGISLQRPKWFGGHMLLEVAPKSNMLYMSEKRYTPLYKEILEKVDFKQFLTQLARISKIQGGKDIALLCYEKPEEFCHRRLLAEWIEKKTGYKVEEWNYVKKEIAENDLVTQGNLFVNDKNN